MNHTYTMTQWEDAPSTETPINAENLNHIEMGLGAIYYEVGRLENSIPFRGDVTSGTDISGLTAYSKGWYWVVSAAGTYVGESCDIGDIIICISDYGNAYDAADFSVIHSTPATITAITNAEIDAIVAS